MKNTKNSENIKLGKRGVNSETSNWCLLSMFSKTAFNNCFKKQELNRLNLLTSSTFSPFAEPVIMFQQQTGQLSASAFYFYYPLNKGGLVAFPCGNVS